MDDYVEMEYIVPRTITKRAYQTNIFNAVRDRNALVVIPTGLGKTVLAMMVIAHKFPVGTIFFLAPTKPLCEQHYASVSKFITVNEDEVALITGETMKKKERTYVYSKARIIVATPQTVENDLADINMTRVGLVIFDEAHRAVGNYAYVPIASACIQQGIQTLGLTASPGSNQTRLKEVIEQLGIEIIEVRTDEDNDVRPYLPTRKLYWRLIELPGELKTLTARLNVLKGELLVNLNKYYKLPISPRRVTKKMLVDTQQRIQRQLAKGSRSMYGAASIISALIKVYHLEEMLTSQGIEAAKAYITKLEIDTSKAAKHIHKNRHYNDFKTMLSAMSPGNPKMIITKQIITRHLTEKPDARIMVFAEYRDTVTNLQNELSQIPSVRATRFIGQTKGSGGSMSQEEQKKVITAFRDGFYNVLISTSIGEEGIDIPATSLVLFYEPVPSAIRHIQRRGRTARGGLPGEVHILIMKDSRDEAYYWSSKRKETKMLDQIKKLQKMLDKNTTRQRPARKYNLSEKQNVLPVFDETGQSHLDNWL